MTVVRSASISGTVTDAIGLPAYGQVSVFRISEKGSTWTRTADIRAGRLAIDKAKPGEYRLRFQIPGQPDTWWPGSAVESEAESIVLNEGDRRSLVVTSAAAVTISGTVVTTEGLLIPGPGSYPARVYAHRLVGDRFEQAGFASLDDAGGYRLNVLPGRYALEFEGISGFAREFTGDASLLSEAQTFEAAPGAPVVRDAVLGLGGSIAGSATWADEVVAIDADGRVAEPPSSTTWARPLRIESKDCHRGPTPCVLGRPTPLSTTRSPSGGQGRPRPRVRRPSSSDPAKRAAVWIS